MRVYQGLLSQVRLIELMTSVIMFPEKFSVKTSHWKKLELRVCKSPPSLIQMFLELQLQASILNFP